MSYMARYRRGLSHRKGTHWQLKVAGQVVQDASRRWTLRHTVMNHWAHHRGQLTVYLRLLDRPIPSIYGPTADDSAF